MIRALVAATAILLAGENAVADAMTFSLETTGGNCYGCAWVAAQGTITPDTPDRLRRALEEHSVRYYVFDSPGGNLVAALEMGNILREADAATGVGRTVPERDSNYTSRLEPGRCASACAFAFLGGTTRLAQDGEIGVHQFYNAVALETPENPIFTALDLSANQFLGALLINYAVDMGVDSRFVSAASLVPPTSMRWLSDSDLETWNVTYNPEAFGRWSIEPWNSGIVAYARSADELTTATVFCGSDKVPTLFITSEVYWWKEGEFTDPRPFMDEIIVFGVTIPISDVSISYRPGKYDLRVKLANFDASNLPEADKIGIEAFVGRAYSVMFSYRMRRDGASENMRAALRNCI